MEQRELKIGDRISASQIQDGIEYFLQSVMQDVDGLKWAIVVDTDGVPHVLCEEDIDHEVHYVQLTLPEDSRVIAPKKKAKK